MLFKFYNPKGANFVFRASSVEQARTFVLHVFGFLSDNSNDGIDWVGNHLTILSTVGEGYMPLLTINDDFIDYKGEFNYGT